MVKMRKPDDGLRMAFQSTTHVQIRHDPVDMEAGKEPDESREVAGPWRSRMASANIEPIAIANDPPRSGNARCGWFCALRRDGAPILGE